MMISEMITAFVLGAAYESFAVTWAQESVRRRSGRAAFASLACAACMLGGLRIALESIPIGAAYAFGWAFGTWITVIR